MEWTSQPVLRRRKMPKESSVGRTLGFEGNNRTVSIPRKKNSKSPNHFLGSILRNLVAKSFTKHTLDYPRPVVHSRFLRPLCFSTASTAYTFAGVSRTYSGTHLQWYTPTLFLTLTRRTRRRSYEPPGLSGLLCTHLRHDLQRNDCSFSDNVLNLSQIKKGKAAFPSKSG